MLLGAAPGVGKTYAMLEEARHLRDEGRDVVVGFVEPHGRAATTAMLDGLEVVAPRAETHRGLRLEEMDVDAVLARRPEVALVDELAHANAPGSRNARRWQDVDELLDAGIDVISTVNTEHIESLGDVVTEITGELVDPVQVADHHPDADDEHVWAGWRAATLDELVHTWPARTEPGEYERLRGWWQPTLEGLRVARSSAKSRERRRSIREAHPPSSS